MTEVFNWRVHADASGGGDFTVASVQFGDGYAQESPLGINNEVQVWDVTAHAYRDEMKNELLAFIRARKGMTFFWTPPLGTQGYYRAKGYRLHDEGGGLWTISMKFEQRFMP